MVLTPDDLVLNGGGIRGIDSEARAVYIQQTLELGWFMANEVNSSGFAIPLLAKTQTYNL